MSYGKSKYNFKIGDRVKVDLKLNGKVSDGEVLAVVPRIGILTAGSVEWLVKIIGTFGDGMIVTRDQWVSETCIEAAS